MKEQVLILIKPDAMRKTIAGEVISIFLNSELKLIGIKLVKVAHPLAHKHYGHLRNKSFYKEIVAYLEGKLHGDSPVIAMAFEGTNAIRLGRKIAGATNPEEADPKTVRGKFGRVTTRGVYENVAHVSSDSSEARREIALWFKKNELLK